MRQVALALLLASLAAGAASAGPAVVEPAVTTWALRAPKPAPIEFHGVVNFDGAGTGNAQFLYPAPTVGFGIASVFVHGAVVSGMKKEQKAKLQLKADLVLDERRAVLDALSAPELLREAFARASVGGGTLLAHDDPKPAAGLVVESLPVFAMTQDRRTLILDAAILMHHADKPKEKVPAYQNVVRIVSSPREGADLVALWNADGGRALREEMVRMYAEALDLALRDVGVDPAVDAAAPFKTVRYREGDAERMERARLLGGSCGRVVMRNLRGWLMSVPVREGSIAAMFNGAGACPAAPAPASMPAAEPAAAPAATPVSEVAAKG